MDDQALTIRIEAEDAFSPAFEQVREALAQTRTATVEAAQGFAGLNDATSVAAMGLEGMQRALAATAREATDQEMSFENMKDEAIKAADRERESARIASAAAQDHVRMLDADTGPDRAAVRRAEAFLENQALPPVVRSGIAGFRQGPGIEALGGNAGVDFQGVADNLSDMTGGATSGMTGGMLAGGVGAGISLLMQNPLMQQYMARLNTLLQQLITPIAESLGPSLDALAPLIQELRPTFVLIGESLRLYLSPLVQEMRLLFQAEQTVVAALKPVSDALEALKSSIENVGSPFGGGGGGGPHLNIGGVQIFDTGGIVGPDSGPAPVGLPGHRLVLAQLGERLSPPGGVAAGASASAFHFHVQASDPRAAAQQIRQVIEELIVTRRLGVA